MIVPDAIEPIIGWRYWNLDDDGRLRSLHRAKWESWSPKEALGAQCHVMTGDLHLKPGWGRLENHEGLAPVESCRCGIYAAKDLETLRTLVMGCADVVGEVYLWGKVIPGENGYRAQFAYPKSLRLISDCAPDEDLNPLRIYCDDVGVMAPSEAWPMGTILTPIVNFGVSVKQFVSVLSAAATGMKAFEDSVQKVNEIVATTSSLHAFKSELDTLSRKPDPTDRHAHFALPNGKRGDYLALDPSHKRGRI